MLNYPTNLLYCSKIDVLYDKDGTPIPNLVPKDEYDTDRYYRNDGAPGMLISDKGGFTDVSRSQAYGIWHLD